MASVRGILNIQSLNELTYENAHTHIFRITSADCPDPPSVRSDTHSHVTPPRLDQISRFTLTW
jgi:hypothetical protein